MPHKKLQENIKQASLFDSVEGDRSWFCNALNVLGVSDEGIAWPDKFGRQLRKELVRKKTIKTLSLFSGGGGLDIAFSDAGFTIVECVEIEKKFVETLEASASAFGDPSHLKVHCIDIREYHPKFDKIDFIIGGPPCQTFSAAGARAAGVKGLDDQRGTLFEEYVRLVKRLQPKGFLFENVYRIVGAQNGRPWKRIRWCRTVV